MTQVEDNLVAAIKVYVTETKTNCLDLRNKSLSLKVIESVFKFLPDTEVTELNLEGNDLSQGVGIICELLKKTKLKKLSLSDFPVSKAELLALLDVLKDSEVDLGEFVFKYPGISEIVDGRFFVPELLQSRLTKLTVEFQNTCPAAIPRAFVKGLPSTSLTSLKLQTNGCVPNVIAFLFSLLPGCQIKDLNLTDNGVNDDVMKKLGGSLKASKVEKLTLKHNCISDTGLVDLAEELVDSNVTDLNLSFNKVSGSNEFGRCLKETKIRVLGLSYNEIKHSRMFNLPNFLKGSCVETLDISYCHLSDIVGVELLRSIKSSKLTTLNLEGNFLRLPSILEFAAVIKDTSLEDVNLSANNYPEYIYDMEYILSHLEPERLYNDFPTETFDALNGAFKDSKLKSIKLDGPYEPGTTSLWRFLDGTKNSSLRHIKIGHSEFSSDQVELLAEALKNSTFTHFKITTRQFGSVFSTFACNLKYSAITHLNLSCLTVSDDEVKILAAHLKGTKIMELYLADNLITNEGAIALAHCLPETSLISLYIDRNRIDKDGLQVLAERSAGTFITTLSVIGNNGIPFISEKRLKSSAEFARQRGFTGPLISRAKGRESFPPIEKNLWENKMHARNLVISFKQIFPITKDGNFSFQEFLGNRNFSDYMEECFQLYKKIVERPAAVSVLFQEESISLSLEELSALLYDEFPRQLVEFIANWVEADIADLLKLLERADKLGLVRIVEHLLLLRPLFMIDKAEGILHPYVYTLMLKYKQPLCSEAVEPQGISKIKDFFVKHSDLEGAADLTEMLTKVTLVD